MKLRLPNKLQAALMAALASISFTTLSSGTLSAAFFFGSQAFAEEAADNTGATIDIGDTNLDAQAAIDEEEGKGEAKEPGSAPINQAGFNGIRGSSDDFDRQSTAEAATEASIDTENVGTADQANCTGTSADLPSDDLGFTSNPYAAGSDTSNGSGVDSPVTSFTQAPQIAPTGGYSAAGTGSGSSTNKTTTGGIGGVARPMALTASNLGSPVSSLSVDGTSLGGYSGSRPAPAMLGAADQQAQAEQYKGMEFSGDVFTIEHATNQTFHNATFSSWYQDENGRWRKGSHTWGGGDSTYYVGEEARTLPAGNSRTFWRRLFGDADGGDKTMLGNTIRLTRATGDVYYESTFGPYQLGGIIVEEGNSGTYVLGRHEGSCAIHIKAKAGEEANMYVASNLGLSSNTSIDIDSSGTWKVFDGKSLTLALYNNTGNLSSIVNTPKITFNDGVTVSMVGGGTVDMTHTNNLTVQSGATISVGEGTTLRIATTGASVYGKALVGSGGGATAEAGSSDAFTQIFMGKAVNVQDGGKLVLVGNVCFNDTVTGNVDRTSGVADLEITGSLRSNVSGKSNPWVLGDHKMKVGGDFWLTNQQHFNLAGGTIEVGGALKLGHESNGTNGNYKASLNATAGSTVKLHDVMFYGGRDVLSVDGSSITFTKADGNVLSQDTAKVPTAAADLNSVSLNNATLVAQENSWTLDSIASSTVTVRGASKLDIAGGNTIQIGHASVSGSFTALDGSTGTLQLNDATFTGTVGITGANVGVGGTVTLDLANFNAFEVADATGQQYSYNNVSGFLTASGKYYLVHATGEPTSTATWSGSFADGSATYDEASSVNGNIVFSLNTLPPSTSYYVNADMNTRSDVTDGTNNLLTKATDVYIKKGVTLTAFSYSDSFTNPAKLHGAGTYALAGSSKALNGNLSLGDDWTGIVRLTGVGLNGENLASTLTKNGSWVEMYGVTGGHIDGWNNGTQTANFILTDKDANTVAWKYSNGASDKETVVTFTGTFTGDGTFFKDDTKFRQGFKFTGDISGWNGNFWAKTTQANAITRIEFAEGANEVNLANIVNKGSNDLNVMLSNTGAVSVASNINKESTGAVNITVGSSAQATFAGTINATTLAVAAGGSATLNANTTVGGLTGAGNIVSTNTITLNSTGDYTFDGALTTLTLLRKNENTATGTQTFNGLVTVTGDTRTEVYKGGFNFNAGYKYTGGNKDYAIVTASGTTVHFGGDSDMGGKLVGNGGSSTIVVDEGATLTARGFWGTTTSSSGNGAVTIASGAKVTTTSNFNTSNLVNSGSLTVGGQLWVTTLSGSGDLTITNDLKYDGGADGSYSGSISAKNITKEGAGKLTLSGENTFTNITQLSAGTLEVAQVGSLGGQGVTTSANTSLIFNTADDGIYGGSITGIGSVTKSGEGNLVLTGANSYTGTTTINAGTLVANSISALGSGAVMLNGGTLDITSTVGLGTGSFTMDGGTLKLNQESGLTSTNGSLAFTSGTLDLTGLQIEAGNDYTLASSTGGAVTLGGGVNFTIDPALQSQYELKVQDNTLVLSYIQPEPTETLLWLDPEGTWGRKGAWYREDKETRISFEDGANVSIEAPYEEVTINMATDAAANNMTVKKGEGITAATTVTVQDTVNENRLEVRNLDIQEGTTLVAKSQIEVTGTAVLGSQAQLNLQSAKDATIAANISSTDDTAVITKSAASTLTLTGDNSLYTGDLNVTGGKLVAQGEKALGAGTVSMAGGTTLSLEHSGVDATPMEGGSLSLAEGATISFLGNTSLDLSGSLTLGSGVNWDLSRYAFGDTVGTGLTATLVSVTGSMDATSIANLQSAAINTPGNIANATLSYSGTADSPGAVILTFDMTERHLYWKGGAGEWTINSSVKDWHPSEFDTSYTSFATNDGVTFDSRVSLSSVTLTEDITAGTVTVENGTRVTLQDGTGNATLTAEQIDISGTLGTQVNVAAGTVNIQDTGTWNVSGDANREFAGEITGTGTLAKSGTGDLELAHSNTAFTGEIQLNAGSITAAVADALGGAGATIAMGDGTEIKQAGDLAYPLNMGGKTIEVTDPGANATVSANLDVAQGTFLTFAGNGDLSVTGAVTGTGTLTQDGYGTLNLDNVQTFQGDIVANHGGVALGSETQSRSITMGVDSTLTFAGTGKLNINTLSLSNGSAVDLSNITFDENNKAVLAIVSTLNAPKSSSAYGTTDLKRIEGVSVRNAQGLEKGQVVRLGYGSTDGGKTEFYAEIIDVPSNAVYWKGADANDPLGYEEGSGIWRPTIQGRTDDEDQMGYLVDSTGAPTLFVDKIEGQVGFVTSSIYFNTLTNSKKELIKEATVFVWHHEYPNPKDPDNPIRYKIQHIGTMIVEGETKYIFEGHDESGNDDLQLSANEVATLLVKSGAEVEIRTSFFGKDGSLVDIENGAVAKFDANDGTSQVEYSFIDNCGETSAMGNQVTAVRLINENKMTIDGEQNLYEETGGWAQSVSLGVVVNTASGDLSISADGVGSTASNAIDRCYIVNEGNLTFEGRNTNPSQKMLVMLPVSGRGVVNTDGDKRIIFDSGYDGYYNPTFATVHASELNLGAASTVFNYGVDITDSTTVKAGKHAYFYGGTGVGGTGSLGEVALEDASSITFGPRVEVNSWGEPTGVTAQSYDMGQVTAGADSVLTVQNGATVTMDGFNAASGVPAGGIVVGTTREGAEEASLGDASLVIGREDNLDAEANVDVFTVLNGTATINVRADINQIMQDGGVLTLNANSVLNGVPVSAEPDAALTGGTVTGGTLALAGGVTLEQNAVIDVRNATGAETAGSYTVNGGAGSRIDATSLDLEVDYTNSNFIAVVRDGGEGVATRTASGFMSAGDEFVKLFDLEYTDEDGKQIPVQTLTSNNEAVYHASASDLMTLIGNDNWSTLQSELTEGSYNLQEYIGYGYLHTDTKVLKTYYVRDLYTEMPSETEVRLSDIMKGSEAEDPETQKRTPQLENVVFDVTTYNQKAEGNYNGTLTVDANVAVDLFTVAGDATAAINIESDATVRANADSTGVAGTLELMGDGVYEITDRNDLGTKIRLSNEVILPSHVWAGTVRVTGTSTDLTLEDKYVGEGADASTIEFRNWNGALNGGDHDHEIDAQIQLTSTQTAPTAMKLTGEDAIAYTFTNTVSGSGNIDHAEGGNVAMTFSGDTSGWSGTYEQLSATSDSLAFTGGTEVNAKVTSGNGSMNLTYGGSVTTVAGGVNVYSGGDTPTTMNVAYTGGGAEEGSVKNMEVKGGITSDAQSSLTLTVGDGESRTAATFSGIFAGTENATMAVKDGSTAVIGKNAELLRVVGDEGSNVVVNSGSTLSLASTTPETGYSEFHDLTNAGTIEMMANGGEIHLVDDTAEGNTYNLGNLVLTDPVGTATIETSGVEGKTTNVNITGLTGPKSAAQVLELTNGNGTGTVNYNLGNTDDTKDLNGTIAYGGSGGVTNLVLQENGNSAASAVLETRFTSADAVATANVVVDAKQASIQGLTSDANSNSNKTMVVSGREDPDAPGNRTLNITGDDEYTYAGTLGSKLDIAYTGDGSQTIEGGVENFRGKVTVDNGSAQAGVLELLNASSVNITDLTIGANDTLDLKKNDSNVGTAVVSGTMKAGGAGGTPSKLDGSLTLNDTAIYDVSASAGSGGLNLTGALTINSGAMLSTGDMGVVWNMGVGDTYDLAFGVTDMTSFGTDVDWNQGVDASTVFGNGMKEGEYYIRYSGTGEGGHGGNVGAVYLFRVAVPEPTTSTLSLLALAALAARRKRK